MSFTDGKNEVDMVENNIKQKDSPSNGPDVLAEIEAPNPWGKGHKRLYMYCALIYLCSTMNGMLSCTGG